MALQRPGWTVCFFAIWLAIFIASILMHVAVATIVPAISALPTNLGQGLLDEFGIGTMADESVSIMISTNKALRMCESDDIPESGSDGRNDGQESWCETQASRCTGESPPTDDTIAYGQASVDTTEYVDKILASYEKSLAKVVRIGDDPYLGTAEFQEASSTSKEIKAKVEEVRGVANGPCCPQIPLYCNLYDLGKTVNGLTEMAQSGVDAISENEGVLMFEAYSGYLNGFHALPYDMVICMVFYTILWYKNGNFCCCQNGKFIDFCCIILPQTLFWLIGCVTMAIFTVLGYAITIIFNVTEIGDLPNTPTIQELIDHISVEYSTFWDLCFKDLISGMEFFRIATTIFFLVAWLIFFHACCFCCCKPYPMEDGKAEG